MTGKRRKTVVQKHHVVYASPSVAEWTEIVYVGEHEVLWKTQRRKRFSWGFIRSMEFELNRARKVAVVLDEPSRLKK